MLVSSLRAQPRFDPHWPRRFFAWAGKEMVSKKKWCQEPFLDWTPGWLHSDLPDMAAGGGRQGLEPIDFGVQPGRDEDDDLGAETSKNGS